MRRVKDEGTQAHLVIKQYQQKRDHIVQNLTETQELGRVSVSKSSYSKNADIVSTCNATQNGILEAEKVSKKSTTATFESKWAASLRASLKIRF